MQLSKQSKRNNQMNRFIKLSVMKSVFAICLIFISLMTLSCRKDFKEINTNPTEFTDASDGALYNSIVQSLLPGWNEQFYINNEILYKQTQLAALTQENWGNYPLGTEDLWNLYYSNLPTFRELQKRTDAYEPSPAVNNIKAILKITLAYKTFKLTDLFGDIPFSEAGYGYQNVNLLHPKYDKQRDIYLKLLDDLKWAADSIDTKVVVAEPYTTFAKFDLLFNGNLKMWQKFANSLRLRYAMRMSDKEPVIAGNIIKEIIENDLPVLLGYNKNQAIESLESACLWPIRSNQMGNSISWSFREHKNLRMGSNIWHQFSSTDDPGGSGIFDPRVYIFFEGDSNNLWRPYPQIPAPNTPASLGQPYLGYRDDSTSFDLKIHVNYSPFNYFIIADANYMPVILMTSAEVSFLKAEAYFRGIGVGVDKNKADDYYMDGMATSIDWWVGVSKSLRLPLSGLNFTKKNHIPTELNTMSVQMHFGSWNATTEEQKLAFIYTQRWIDAFRQPWEAFAEARRTGMTPREGDPIPYYRLPYPETEMQYNAANCLEAKNNQGGDDFTVKLWWCK